MSNESITSLSPQGYPPLRKALPALLTQVIVGVAIAGAFVGLYVGLQRQPTPHLMPIAVVGEQTATAFSAALGDKVDIRTVTDADQAKGLVRTHQTVAAVVPGQAGFALYLAGADGKSVTGASTALVTAFAAHARIPIASTTDLVPLSADDSVGLSGFYLVFGSTLAAFIVAQVLNQLGGLARLRTRLVVLAVSVIASGTVAAVLAGPVYGSVPAPTGLVVAVLSLLGAAIALSTLAVATLIGPLGNILSTLLFTTLGNSTSGATVSNYLLPPFFSTIGAALPPGAAFRAVVDYSYYDGRDVGGPLLVLIAWIVAASAVLWLATRLRRPAPAEA